jgi:hypothetical protein
MEMMHSSTQLHQQFKRQLLLMLVAITLEHPASMASKEIATEQDML